MKPRRSLLIVPGHNPKMHVRAATSKADMVVLDLEDGVPLAHKKEARQQIAVSLKTLDWQGRPVAVRINGLDTAFGYRDLLEVAENAGSYLDAVVIPKVDDAGDVHFVERMLAGIESACQFEKPIAIEASIESARGLDRVSEIARSSSRLTTLVFGIADYSASIGARLVSISGHGEHEEKIYPGHRWNFVLSRIVMAAKANGLQAIDAPYGNFKDAAGLERSAVTACALGCDGKWAIHPDQIDVLNRVFCPSKDDIELALKVIAAHQQTVASGQGAVALEGRMIDRATVNLAEKLVSFARQLGLVD